METERVEHFIQPSETSGRDPIVREQSQTTLQEAPPQFSASALALWSTRDKILPMPNPTEEIRRIRDDPPQCPSKVVHFPREETAPEPFQDRLIYGRTPPITPDRSSSATSETPGSPILSFASLSTGMPR